MQTTHWDQAYQQYQLNNYRYIDSQGILHENTLQYLDAQGRVHAAPMHFFDTEGRVHAKEYLDEIEEIFEPQPVQEKYMCYRGMSPRRKNPNVKRVQKYVQRKKLSYIAANRNRKSNNHHDEDAEISELQKQLND